MRHLLAESPGGFGGGSGRIGWGLGSTYPCRESGKPELAE